MTDPNRNALWARALVEELVRSGVRDFCIAPGSRSTALVLAVAAVTGDLEDVRARVFLDERSAAFFALGVGKATGRPAAVVTTSGTAVANLLPAVVEAHQAEAPLILLTADRPHHLRDSDANQAIRQPDIFGSYTRAAWDLPQPAVNDDSLRHLRTVGVRAVAAAVGDPAGPVHLNVPFRKPLEPTEVAGDVAAASESLSALASAGRQDGAPLVQVGRRVASAPPETVQALADAITRAERPVLVLGPSAHPEETGPTGVRLAAASGMPLLADPLSGARTGPGHGALRVGAYDLFLRDPATAEALAPDLIVRCGTAPTSASLQRWLKLHESAQQVVVDAGSRWKDFQNTARSYVQADPGHFMAALLEAVDRRTEVGWRDRWSAVDRAAITAALDAPGPRHEGHLAARLMDALPEGTPVFISSSMPIRDVDGFGGVHEKSLPVYGNRGASGIDGIISTAAGVAAGSRRRAVLLLGDLAFLHDANGLLALREKDVELTVIVVNNDGGGIFHMLPIREFDPPFTALFATPHGLDLRHLAELHGLRYDLADGPDAGMDAIVEAAAAEGSRVLEIRTDRDSNRVGHEASVAATAAAARDALDNFSTDR